MNRVTTVVLAFNRQSQQIYIYSMQPPPQKGLTQKSFQKPNTGPLSSDYYKQSNSAFQHVHG